MTNTRLIVAVVLLCVSFCGIVFLCTKSPRSYCEVRVPEGAEIRIKERRESGFDGHIREMFTCNDTLVEAWMKEVQDYTGRKWQPCPIPSKIEETHWYLPRLAFEAGDGVYTYNLDEDGIAEEVFYVSAKKECWWLDQW